MSYTSSFSNEGGHYVKPGSALKGSGDKESSAKLNSMTKIPEIKKLTPSEIRERRSN